MAKCYAITYKSEVIRVAYVVSEDLEQGMDMFKKGNYGIEDEMDCTNVQVLKVEEKKQNG